jgi:hypothetical protein
MPHRLVMGLLSSFSSCSGSPHLLLCLSNPRLSLAQRLTVGCFRMKHLFAQSSQVLPHRRLVLRGRCRHLGFTVLQFPLAFTLLDYALPLLVQFPLPRVNSPLLLFLSFRQARRGVYWGWSRRPLPSSIPL